MPRARVLSALLLGCLIAQAPRVLGAEVNPLLQCRCRDRQKPPTHVRPEGPSATTVKCCCCDGSKEEGNGESANDSQSKPAGRQPETKEKAKITGMGPGTLKPSGTGTIFLRNFNPDRDALWIDKTRVDSSSITKGEKEGEFTFNVPKGVPSGDHKIRVGLGGAEPGTKGGGADVTVHDDAWFLKTRWLFGVGLGALVTFSLGGLLILLSRAGVQNSGTAPRWLIDAETNSYSLQRIQFLGWTALAVFGYAYVALCFVRLGHWAAPELPEDLIKLLGISAGTSVFGNAVRALKGSEGAGKQQPRWKDLVTAGEVVALDKVQLLTWTIVGWLSFLISVVGADISNLSAKMPSLSSALWQLAGLSGGIYVAGKAVRDPGPVLAAVKMRQIAKQGVAAPPSDPPPWGPGGGSAGGPGGGSSGFYLQVELKGSKLSRDATFQIGGKIIPFSYIHAQPRGDEDLSAHLPRVTVPGDVTAGSFAKGLSFVVDSDWIELADVLGDGRRSVAGMPRIPFVIENPDGQKAELDCLAGRGATKVTPPETPSSETTVWYGEARSAAGRS